MQLLHTQHYAQTVYIHCGKNSNVYMMMNDYRSRFISVGRINL